METSRIRVAALTGLALAALAVLSPPQARAQAQPPATPPDCKDDAAAVTFFASPLGPWKGAPLRVLYTAETPLDAELTLLPPQGSAAATSATRLGGPPYSWMAEVPAPAPGTWKAVLLRKDTATPCVVTRDITVKRERPSGPAQTKGSVWPLRGAWDQRMESLYSAWIERLFDAPLDAAPSWKALHEVLRDKSRNILFNHLGLREDEKSLVLRPDCADLPYFLRGYFAFKLGLPFGYAKCNRGGGGQAPRCHAWWNIQKEEPPPEPELPAGTAAGGGGLFGGFFGKSPPKQQTAAKLPPGAKSQLPPGVAPKLPPKPEGLVPGFGYYMQTIVADRVHSGSGRTEAKDDQTDYYPVPLTAQALRPGTVYADPYGHLLVLVRRVAQTGDAAGVLLAVDGQPDGTVARKRFWRGNFLFANDPALGGPGFKRFRPVVRDGAGSLRRLTNAEITANPQYADFSLDQSRLAVEDFYDRMDDVMSPDPLDPARALKEAIVALEEQVKARVTSVENGRTFLAKGPREVDIPDGPSIFETTGAWEDFATPSRDLRLLIAIDVVRGFPDRVARRPDRYAMPAGKGLADVKAELDAMLSAELGTRKFSYPRTDGSPWTLSLKDLLERTSALEAAYNVNDCAEARWGAPDGSEEAQTCKRRASRAQQQKMEQYRAWFHERRRPARG